MNNDQKLTTVVSFTLMLATAVLGWFTLSDRLSLPKISADRSLGVVVASEQDVTARLWEDPLQAVQMEAGKKGNEAAHETRGMVEAVRRKLGATNRVYFLVVPIPGTPFPDDVETRLRLRYSIQMAVADQDCSPEDRSHLGYVKLPWSGDEGVHLIRPQPMQTTNMVLTNVVFAGRSNVVTQDYGFGAATPQTNYLRFSNTQQKRVNVPYEWFESRNAADLKLVVLWLPEEFLSNEPLCRLAYLRDTLSPTNADLRARCFGPFVVGPRSSNTLKVMAQGEFSPRNHVCAGLLATKLRIFSPQATAPDALINLTATNDPTRAREDLVQKLSSRLPSDADPKWIYFKNFIAPDDQLADLLVRELDLRSVNLRSNSADRVLLLAEADTSYGRALPLAFQAALESFREAVVTNRQSKTPTRLAAYATTNPPTPANLIVARYLQGLDAQKGFQDPDNNAAKGARSAEQALAEMLNKKSAPAVGESQLDYAERLAEQLARDETCEQVKAVGILGSDIYDKLVLLRSLRARFPEALFFTTDLDARLWYPDHFKFTRNLVVASAHDLKMEATNSAFQIAPFRDVYQVAVFNACTAAIGDAVNSTSQTSPDPQLTPGIYEIGRGGAVKLNPADPHLIRVAMSKRAVFKTTGMQLMQGLKNYASFSPFRFEFFVAGGGLLLWIILRRYRSKDAGSPILWRDLIGRRTGWVGVFFLATTLILAVGAAGANDQMLRGFTLFWAGGWLLLCVFQMGDLCQDRVTIGQVRFAELFQRRTGWGGWFLLGTVLLLVLSALAFSAIEKLPGGEPWSWSRGVSVWPTELVRLFIICGLIWMLVWVWQRFRHHRLRLILNYRFAKDWNLATVKSLLQTSVWARVFSPWPKATPVSGSLSLQINAAEVFQCYLAKTTWRARMFRAVVGGAIYFLLGVGWMLMSGMPLNTHIRGVTAGGLDVVILFVSIIGWLVLVFYVLDAVCIGARMLKCIGGPHTIWPEMLLEKKLKDFGVQKDDLEGYLDVQFAADKTQETGQLIFLPFLIQFLMLMARNSYFDNWSWPPFLVLIFVGNVLLSATAWVILRRAAAGLRNTALQKLGDHLRQAEMDLAMKRAGSISPEIRKLGLQEIKRRIEGEHRGAYARWMQDPAFLALLVPTGLLGILNVLFQALFGFR